MIAGWGEDEYGARMMLRKSGELSPPAPVVT